MVSRISGGMLAAVGLASLLGGCASSGERNDSLAAPVAAMPIVNLPARAPVAAVSFEAIMRDAQARDVARMVDATNRVEDVVARAEIAARVASAVAAQDLDFATHFATALPPGRAREASLSAIVSVLASRRDADPLAWAMSLQDPAAAFVARRAAVVALVRANPRAAIDRVLALPENREREDLLGVAIAAWARQDATAAVDWVRALPENDRKKRLSSTVAFTIAQANPDRALALAETLPAGRDRWLLFSAIGETWVARDPKGALAWANKLPAGDPRDAAFAGIDTGLGMPSQRRVASAPGVSGAGRARGGLGASSETWPEMSSPDFAAWFATQRRGMTREEAILEYVRERGALQPSAVGPWLASLPGGPARDRAMEIFVDGLLLGSPADAARWLSALPRSDQSTELIERTARRWLLTNPDAAEIWLRDTPLPLDRQQQLLHEFGR